MTLKMKWAVWICLVSINSFFFQAKGQQLIDGINHVSIKVADMKEGVRFYNEGLGLKIAYQDKERTHILTPDGITIELVAGGEKTTNSSGITHICLNTYDVDATFQRALEYGAIISRPENPEPYTYKNLRMAFVAAPTGEEIEFWYIEKNNVKSEPIVNNQYIKCFVHVAMTVPDMPASVKFYEGLGIKLKVDWEWGCSMQLKDLREFELFTKGTYSDNKNSYVHFGLFTSDINAALKKVEEMGGKVVKKPYNWDGKQVALFRGLAGETVQLIAQDSKKAGKFFNVQPVKLVNLFD